MIFVVSASNTVNRSFYSGILTFTAIDKNHGILSVFFKKKKKNYTVNAKPSELVAVFLKKFTQQHTCVQEDARLAKSRTRMRV